MPLLISFAPLLPKTQPFTFHSSLPRKSIQHYQSFFRIRSSLSMEQTTPEVLHDFSPFLKIYKDGRVERIKGIAKSPPTDPQNKVLSKDVLYSPQLNLTSRIYIPKSIPPNKKLPLYIYFHGGGFCVETPFSPLYHNYLNNQVAEASVIAVSVDYRLVPENPLPAAYDDSWAALKWVASHANSNGVEEWLNNHADFSRVFLGGDSAGANIAHQIGLKYGEDRVDGVDIKGVILIHPFFWGKEAIGNEPKEVEMRARTDAIWKFANPTSSGSDDPLINPILDSNLSKLGCEKVLVIVAEKDFLRDRGLEYYEKLGKSGWKGVVEIMENKEEGHVFHLENHSCENALAIIGKISSFINGSDA